MAPKKQDKPKRIFLSLPPGIAKALERWAEKEENRPTSLANWIVETRVREELEKGTIPPPDEDEDLGETGQLLALLEEHGNDVAIAELCHDLMLPEGTEERIQTLRDKLSNGKEKKVNGAKH